MDDLLRAATKLIKSLTELIDTVVEQLNQEDK